MVAGKNTPMEKLITLAGGENAINEFDDFKPLTPEAVVKANPDILFLFKSGLWGAGGNGRIKNAGSCTNQCREKQEDYFYGRRFGIELWPKTRGSSG
jgi:ABC-type hemin transport system substrate-binding protein